MLAFLLRPRWIGATLAVIAIAVVFVNLGLWQLRRHDERALENSVTAARLDSAPVALGVLLDSVGEDLESLEYRRTELTGEFTTDDEILLRGQAFGGSPGFHIVTPLQAISGAVVLVDRGWVPLAFDDPPVVEAAPPDGRVTVTGLVRLSQDPAAIGPTEPPGRLEQIARIDLERLSEQFDELAPVWVEITEDDRPMGTTRTGPAPDTTDEGPHLAYAIQWFSFALIGVVGYGLLIRRAASRRAEQ